MANLLRKKDFMTEQTPLPTVLVVDDEPIMIRLLDDLLDSRYDLRFAMTGKEAVASVVENPPDLILLDVELPDMSGYDVCRAVRNNPATQEIPVIFLTSNDRQSDILSGMEAGGMEYLRKPVEITELILRIDTHLQRGIAASAPHQEHTRKKEIPS